MQKKVFGSLLALCMLLAALPLAFSAGAADETWVEIDTADELKLLMDSTDATYLSGNYKLTANTDLTGVEGQSPIGDATTPFTGTFDGADFAISGLNIDNGSSGNAGLFGVVAGTAQGQGVVSDLTVSGTVTSTGTQIGGLVGAITGYATIENCTSLVNVTGAAEVGGIVGSITASGSDDFQVTISNCVAETVCTLSSASTITLEARFGGIVGEVILDSSADCDVVIEKCINKGAVTPTLTTDASTYPAMIGGIAGTLVSGSTLGSSIQVSECVNYADITATRYYLSEPGAAVGGIVGYGLRTTADSSLTIYRCQNHGAITAPQGVGGILGGNRINWRSTDSPYANVTGAAIVIQECYNHGTIIGSAPLSTDFGSIGGIVGDAYPASIVACWNDATVSAQNKNVGGIVGRTVGSSYLYNCYNSGAVSSTVNSGIHAVLGGAGGISGYANNYYAATAVVDGGSHATLIDSTNYTNLNEDTYLSSYGLSAPWVFLTEGNAPELAYLHTHDFGENNTAEECAACGATNPNHCDHADFTMSFHANGSVSYVCGGNCASTVLTVSPSEDIYVGTAERNGTSIASTSFAALADLGSSTNPFLDFSEAMQYAAHVADHSGAATVHILDTATVSGYYTSPTYGGMITITGDGVGTIQFNSSSEGRYIAKGAVTFEKLTFNVYTARFLAFNNKLVLGEGLRTVKTGNGLYVYGGFNGGNANGKVMNTDLTVRSGDYTVVAGWNYGASTTSGTGRITIGKINDSDTLTMTALTAYTHGGSQTLSADSKVTIVVDGDVTATKFYLSTQNNTGSTEEWFITDLVLMGDLNGDATDFAIETTGDPKDCLNIYVDERVATAVADADVLYVSERQMDLSLKGINTNSISRSTYVAYCAANTENCEHSATLPLADADTAASCVCEVCDAASHGAATMSVGEDGLIRYTCNVCGDVVQTVTPSSTVYVGTADKNGTATVGNATLLAALGSEATPFLSFSDAMQYAAAAASAQGSEVTVHILDTATVSGYYTSPEYAGMITITGDGVGTLQFNASGEGRYIAKGAVTFEKLTFNVYTARILAFNNKLVLGEGLSTVKTGNGMYVYGGFNGGNANGKVMNTDVTVRSGIYTVVAGWNYGASTTSGTGRVTIGKINGSDTLTVTSFAAYTHGGAQALSADAKVTITVDGLVDNISSFYWNTLNGTGTTDKVFTTDLILQAGITSFTMHKSDGTNPLNTLNIYVDERYAAAIAAADQMYRPATESTDGFTATDLTNYCNEVTRTTYVAYCVANDLNDFDHGADAPIASVGGCTECGADLTYSSHNYDLIWTWDATNGKYFVACSDCGEAIPATPAAGPTVYVDHNEDTDGCGNDNNGGLTADNAVKTVGEAVRRLASTGGTVVLTGNYVIDSNGITLSEYSKEIVFTSHMTGTTPTIGFVTQSHGAIFSLGGPTKFESIIFDGSDESTNATSGRYCNSIVFEANWNDLIFGQNIQTYGDSIVIAGSQLASGGAGIAGEKDQMIILSATNAMAYGTSPHNGQTPVSFYYNVYLGDYITDTSETEYSTSDKNVTLVLRGVECSSVWAQSVRDGSLPIMIEGCTTNIFVGNGSAIENLTTGNEGHAASLDGLSIVLEGNSTVTNSFDLYNAKALKVEVSNEAQGRINQVVAPLVIGFNENYTADGSETAAISYGRHSFATEPAISGYMGGKLKRTFTGNDTYNYNESVITVDGMLYTCSVCGATEIDAKQLPHLVVAAEADENTTAATRTVTVKVNAPSATDVTITVTLPEALQNVCTFAAADGWTVNEDGTITGTSSSYVAVTAATITIDTTGVAEGAYTIGVATGTSYETILNTDLVVE